LNTTLHCILQIIAVNIQEIKIAKIVDTVITFMIGDCFRINQIDDPPPDNNPTGKPMRIPKVELSYKPHKIISNSILKMPPPIAPIIAQAQTKAIVFTLFRFWTPISDMIFSCVSLGSILPPAPAGSLAYGVGWLHGWATSSWGNTIS
jgi:hypothetical protein